MKKIALVFLLSGFFPFTLILAQNQDIDTLSTSVLKKLSLEELMNINITIVAKHPQQWFEAPASVYVISGDDIRRSGVKNIPEALRLAPNLTVAQVNSSQWAISARGFNNVLANKLLVMIDGRAVYTPLYAGVFWDVNDVMIQDIDHIEVISGPGGTAWGANAVNGVINIITKNSKETQGLFIEGNSGNELYSGRVRFGGQINPGLSYRVYGKTHYYGSTLLINGSDANDSWTMSQGGLRFDWDDSERNFITFQGDYYNGKPDPDGNNPVLAEGGNALTRWTHNISENSDIQLQLFYDKTWRNFGNGFREGLNTYDLDGQHRFQLDSRQAIVWGLGFRLMEHHVDNLPLFSFLPANKTLRLYSVFLQDEITLVENFLSISLGSKFEHHEYTGFEVQPSGHIRLNTNNQTIWASISRAVRTPSRLEREFLLSITPEIPLIAGNPDFKSEEVLAYELGWRFQPLEIVSLSTALFYNDYKNIRSAEPGNGPFNNPIIIGNGVEGKTFGIEMTIAQQLTNWWRLHWGYTFLRKNLSIKSDSQDLNRGTAESDDPEHQFQIQSAINFLDNLDWGFFIRYVDELPTGNVPGYAELDMRLGWKLNEYLELSIVGQNLLHKRHPEFVPSSPSPRLIERSFYGKISFSL